MHPDPNSPYPQLPDWLNTLLHREQTSAQSTEPYQPSPTGTPEQNAAAVIARYWRWQAAGARTSDKDADGNDLKDVKGNRTVQAIDPDTGELDPNFPTLTEINAAEALLTRKQNNDPAAVSAAKDQAAAALAETKARTAQIQASIDKGTNPPSTVQPGEGVRQPDGSYTVPVPTKPPGPQKTQAQIDQDASDAHAAAVRAAANSQTPAQALAARLAEITASAHASADAAIAEKQKLVELGITLTESDKLQLQSKLDSIAEDAKAQHAQAQAQFTHDLAQPNVDIEHGIQQQNATTSAASVENSRVTEERAARLRSAEGQAKALTDQSTAGQSFIKMGLEHGVAPSLGVIQYTFSPLLQAQKLMREAIAAGQAPPNAMPTPIAPQPAAAAAGPPTAPLPAPGATPPQNQAEMT